MFDHKDWCSNDRKNLFQSASKCTRIYGLLRTKGQLFSKCLFGVFNSSKKTNKKFNLTTMVSQVELFLFVFWKNWRYLPKRHFEINWPLGLLRTLFLLNFLTMSPKRNIRQLMLINVYSYKRLRNLCKVRTEHF